MLELPEITYLTGFVANPDELFREAAATLTWDERLRSRRTSSCGVAYNYSGIRYPDTEMPRIIADLAKRLVTVVAHPITNCLANHYETGASTMGFHSDSSEGVVPGSTTAIVSLGATRVLTFRRKARRCDTRAVRLEPGSLLVMAASVQDDWQHALLATDEPGPRASLTFRHVLR